MANIIAMRSTLSPRGVTRNVEVVLIVMASELGLGVTLFNFAAAGNRCPDGLTSLVCLITSGGLNVAIRR